MIDSQHVIAEIKSDEDVEVYRERCRRRYSFYDQYRNFTLPAWSSIPGKPQMKLDGSGPFSWPAVDISGRITIPMTDMTTRMKMTSNAWRNTYFMTAKILTDTLGLDKATELMGYLWIALASSMEGITRRFLKDKPRDCVTLSQSFQLESILEGNDHDIVEESPERVVLRIQCAWWADFKKTWEPLGVDIREPLCNLGCTGWSKEWAKMINPKIQFKKTKYIGDGDDWCEFVYEMDK